MHLFGRKPLLVNVNPVTVRRIQWYSKRHSEAVVRAKEVDFSSISFNNC